LGITHNARCEAEGVALSLAYLIEVEGRELFLKWGYSSMKNFCLGALKYCEGTASKRIWIARTASKFPVVLDYLFERKLTFTSVCFLARHLIQENHLELLEGAVGKQETELRWWLSERFPHSLPPDWDLDGRITIIPLDGDRVQISFVGDKQFVNTLNRLAEVNKHKVPDGNGMGKASSQTESRNQSSQ
jgi:hypothetical protein